MTIGEQLLNLATEYQQAVQDREAGWGGNPSGREPVEIAADYEAAIRELLTRA